jgi:opacity protein-like surface antigen
MRILTFLMSILLFAAPVLAADLQKSMKDLDNRDRPLISPFKATTDTSQSWTGVWAAIMADYSASDTGLSLDIFGKSEGGTEHANIGKLDGLGGEGFGGSLQAGLDAQIGRIVIGGWGEYGIGGTESSASILNGLARLKVEQGDSYGAFASAGIALGDTLIYGAGGYVWTEFDTKLSIGDETTKKSFDFSGPAAEIGIRHRFTPNIQGKFAGRYEWLDKETIVRFGDEEFGGRLTAEPGILTIKAGIVISTTPGQGLLPLN